MMKRCSALGLVGLIMAGALAACAQWIGIEDLATRPETDGGLPGPDGRLPSPDAGSPGPDGGLTGGSPDASPIDDAMSQTCNTAGTAIVNAVYGNTIEYGEGPWGARPENTYVLDETDGILYIVPYDEIDPITGDIATDRVSLYTCNQLTGARGDYTRTDGLDGSPNLLSHTVVFFDTFNDAYFYLDPNGECMR
jgi:hypothetical protein